MDTTRATLLDEWMPQWDVTARHELIVAAPADRTYRAARSADFAASRVARLLYWIRGVVSIARGRCVPRRVTLDDSLGSGFVLLAEQPGVEIVIGVAGRFWRLSGGTKDRITADLFRSYAAPGSAKAAMAF